jgi:hypothetical protein
MGARAESRTLQHTDTLRPQYISPAFFIIYNGARVV